MFKALYSQKVSAQLLLPLFGLLPFMALLIRPGADQPPVFNNQGMLYAAYRFMLENHPIWLIAGAWLLLSLFSTYLFWFAIRFELIGQRTVLISYLYFFLTAIPLLTSYLNPAMLSGCILFLGLVSIFTIYGQARYKSRIFNAGLIFGLGVLLYPLFIFLLPVYLFALVQMRQPKLSDVLILFIGALTVIWIYSAILLVTDSFLYEWESVRQWFSLRETWPVSVPGHRLLLLLWTGWIILLLPMTFAASGARKDAGRRVISVLVQLLWILPVLLLVFERVSADVWGLACLPVSVLLTLALTQSRNRWMAQLFFLITLAFLILFQIDRLV